MAETFDFPDDLREAQQQLHQARAELRAFLADPDLPWSVEPHDGWTDPQDRWYPTQRPATTGWTEEQQQTAQALRARELELVIAVSGHPFWSTLDRGQVVAARMALKRAHEQEDPDGGAAAAAE
ncbi:hypothetical protein ABZ752_00200 [Streptomyces roseifaciens]